MIVVSFLFPLLAFLFPITIYLFVLGLINRRRSPMLASGSWDFGGVLFAASGFLIISGPYILQSIEERYRVNGVVAGLKQAGKFGLDDATFWNVIWVVYFGVIVFGGIFLFWWRGRTTSVYNVELPTIEAALGESLEALGLPWNRWANSFVVRPQAPDADVVLVNQPPASPAFQVDLDPFPLMWHATLVWRGAPSALRRRIEIELEKRLSQTETRENPVAGWFLSLTAFLFFLMFGMLILMIVVTIFPRRG